ncbi:uncharacterized protein LOC128643076 [Bombina bombina]|uniref:uncharacterized protein LOC128643076 n=1 Tax=Bombina bombina TaxID=8345 RepID=UPI00235A5D5C|nr:uncharacterized protein LOC128643076 [Bombina bombina]
MLCNVFSAQHISLLSAALAIWLGVLRYLPLLPHRIHPPQGEESAVLVFPAPFTGCPSQTSSTVLNWELLNRASMSRIPDCQGYTHPSTTWLSTYHTRFGPFMAHGISQTYAIPDRIIPSRLAGLLELLAGHTGYPLTFTPGRYQRPLAPELFWGLVAPREDQRWGDCLGNWGFWTPPPPYLYQAVTLVPSTGHLGSESFPMTPW